MLALSKHRHVAPSVAHAPERRLHSCHDMRMRRYTRLRDLAPLLSYVTWIACSSKDTTTTPVITPTPSLAVTVPDSPVGVTVSAGNSSVVVVFAAPASNGGSAITAYTATCSAAGVAWTGTGATSPITVSGLTNSTTYGCAVTATNAKGTGAASASVAVTPIAPPSATFVLTSPTVANNGALPAAYTCDGAASTLALA